MRTLILVSLLLGLVVVAFREPGEGYPEAAFRIVSDAFDTATQVAGVDPDADWVSPLIPGTEETQEARSSERPSIATEAELPASDETPPLEPRAGRVASLPSEALRDPQEPDRPAPDVANDGAEPGAGRFDTLPEYLPPGPTSDGVEQSNRPASPRAIYREAARLLEGVDR